MITKAKFKIAGMHCTSCAMNIDGELEDSGKVKKVATHYAKAITEVEYDTNEFSEEDIILTIKKTGYTAHVISE